MNINLNDTVKVRLTKVGIDELTRQRDEFVRIFPSAKVGSFIPNIDEDGYAKFQLHTLMNNFGHMLSVGCQLPFHPNILIGDDK